MFHKRLYILNFRATFLFCNLCKNLHRGMDKKGGKQFIGLVHFLGVLGGMWEIGLISHLKAYWVLTVKDIATFLRVFQVDLQTA